MIKIVNEYSKKINLVTRSGLFNSRMILTTAILDMYYEYCSSKITRFFSIEPTVRLLRANKVPKNNKSYDHIYNIKDIDLDQYQSNHDQIRLNGIPYGSSGLAWFKYGNNIVSSYLASDGIILTQEESYKVANGVDLKLIQSIDTRDKDAHIEDGDIHIYSFSESIEDMNPHDNTDANISNKRFIIVEEFAKTVLMNCIDKQLFNLDKRDGLK